MDLYGLVGFEVTFDFTNVPALVLNLNTVIPDLEKPFLNGYFTITQPDGITTTVDVSEGSWNGVSFNTSSEIIRLSPDKTYPRGIYTIIFFAQCTGYTSTQFARSWDMEYIPITQNLESSFDCFTPLLQYKDNSIYGVGGYNM